MKVTAVAKNALKQVMSLRMTKTSLQAGSLVQRSSILATKWERKSLYMVHYSHPLRRHGTQNKRQGSHAGPKQETCFSVDYMCLTAGLAFV